MEAAEKAAKAWNDAKRSLTAAWNSVSLSVASALAPMVTMAANVFKKIVDFVTPIIKGIGEAFKLIGEMLEPVFEAVREWVSSATQAISEFFGGFHMQFGSARNIAINVFEAIGVAGAYTWDTLKVGLSPLLIYVGVVMEQIYSRVVGALANLADVAKQLPDELRPSWIDSFASNLHRVEDGTRNAGIAIRNLGLNSVATWGQSATAVNRYFDNLRKKKDEAGAAPVRPNQILQPPPGIAEYRATAALLKGSKGRRYSSGTK
jgi:hypothetical protein